LGENQADTLAFKAKWTWTGPGALDSGHWVIWEKGRVKELVREPEPGVPRLDLGEGILLPGLVNAHCHLELSFMAGLIPPRGDFVGWMESLVNLRPNHGPEAILKAAKKAALFMAQHGVALVGDITNTGKVQEVSKQAGLSLVSFFEALGSAKAEPPEPELSWQGNQAIVKAVAAHSPYSVPGSRLKRLKTKAGSTPFAIHLAESEAETQYLAGQGLQGRRMDAFLKKRGVFKEELEIKSSSPLAHALELGLLDQNTLLVHGVQLTKEEIKILASTGASLCVCPRSNLGLTGRMALVPDLLAAGVNLALGTDSLSSAPDLCLFSEMKTLMQHYPALNPESVLNMATLGGARALGLGEHFGSLTPGKVGAMAFVPLKRGLAKDEALKAVVWGEHEGQAKAVGMDLPG
jgi:cytosine/adenosine deaminase-related metal-dependent hydrolase